MSGISKGGPLSHVEAEGSLVGLGGRLGLDVEGVVASVVVAEFDQSLAVPFGMVELCPP